MELKEVTAADVSPLAFIVFTAICNRFGDSRSGGGAAFAAPMNRVVIAPDGARVSFHISDDDLPLNRAIKDILGVDLNIRLPEGALEGFFVVDSDGANLRWLGNKVRVPASQLVPYGVTDLSNIGRNDQGSFISGSPNGRLVTFVDVDTEPGSPGDGSLQVMTLDLDTGRRTQLTDLQIAPCQPSDGDLEIAAPSFVDDDTVGFGWVTPKSASSPCRLADNNYRLQLCTVQTDGQHLACADAPTFNGLPVRLNPQITFSARRGFPFMLGSGATGDVARPIAFEIYSQRGRDILQLTSFGHGDTNLRYFDRQRAYFSTSANPKRIKKNPLERCELFSIGLHGEGLRQVTHFNYEANGTPKDGNDKGPGCVFTGESGCAMGTTYRDRFSRTVIFESNCDLFDAQTFGENVFAMRPDGSGIRQVTHTAGCVGDCRPGAPRVGFTDVELPGFLSYTGQRGQ